MGLRGGTLEFLHRRASTRYIRIGLRPTRLRVISGPPRCWTTYSTWSEGQVLWHAAKEVQPLPLKRVWRRCQEHRLSNSGERAFFGCETLISSSNNAARNQPGLDFGPNGTVYISSEIFYSNGANATNAIFGSYAHELANILDEKDNLPGTTGGQGWGRTYGGPHDPQDKDTGAQVEECMYGSLQYP